MILVRGGGAYGKTATPYPFFGPFCLSAPSYPVIYESVTPAAVSRQERSDRVSEEASFHLYPHVAITPDSYIFLSLHEALS